MKRTFFVELIEQARTEDGTVEIEIDGGLEAAQQEAANMVAAVHRLGGSFTVGAIQRKVDELPVADGATVPLHETTRFLFRYDSQLPYAERPPAPEPEPVEAEQS